jgi:outer membrane immunogenic protein
MKIFQTLISFLFFVVGTSAAYAGGALTDYTPPPPPAANSCGGPFAGAYIGGLLGLGGASSKMNPGGISLKDNDKGFTGGGVAGYNWQCNGRLIGIESDISYLNTDTTTGVICPDPFCAGGGSSTFGSEINWYGTLRARVGLVGDENFLVFATGGLAYGGLDHSLDSVNAVTNIPGERLTFSGSRSDTAIGWTAGGGVEYLLRDNWSFRADAMYVDFGSEDETFTATAGNGCLETTCRARVSYDDSFWVARVGLTYLFGARPEPVDYTPLK